MLIRSNHSDFDKNLLDALKYDPVHPATVWNERRTSPEDREIYFMMEDDKVAYVLCTAFTRTLPDSMEEIFYSKPTKSRHKFAIFYSVFKTPYVENPRHSGGWLILNAASYIKSAYPTVDNFVTMSPIPSLRKTFEVEPSHTELEDWLISRKDPVSRFHIRNGASLLRIIPNADASDIRQEQSWGMMANYDYSTLVSTL